MSKEIWTMLGVGVALGMLLFHTTGAYAVRSPSCANA